MKEIFENKTILITGGTGYLGRALTREILKYKPQSIRIYSRDEVKHHRMLEQFKEHEEELRSLIGDVRDFDRLNKAMKGVDIVIHAAALKRIDILEYNVEEVIKTNILGTLNVVNACLENAVQKAIFISTDKACAPVNTYGACKFVGERIFTESNFNKGRSPTKFICVRYGNVLESTGSVIPFFEEKIKKGQEIPLTDKRMTRFVISPQQAVQLIFKALRYGVGGEVFIPKLPAFEIPVLIEILKEKHGASNGIKVIGLRPGEKIHEFMVNYAEIPKTYDFQDMYVITSPIEKYIPVQERIYTKEGKQLSEEVMTEYSSEQAVIPKEEVRDLFKKLGLI